MGSQVAQSSKTGFQGQPQLENIGLWTGSQSKWSYYYEKRGWDENAKQRPHPLNTAPYTASEGAKALPEYYINP